MIEPTLRQIVVQESNAPEKRALAQYGSDPQEIEQNCILYNDLSKAEKAIYNAFVNMIKTKK
jgi:hypothetical protein